MKVSVSDQGIGISKEDQKKLFKLFEFTKETADDNTQGIGLGLTICDSIIKQINGTIDVNSTVGLGSEFTFILHLHKNHLNT